MNKQLLFISITICSIFISFSGCLEENTKLPNLTADFNYKPIYPKATEIISFNSTSKILEGEIKNWSWDFGDGTLAYGENVTHKYNNVNTYNVKLKIIDNENKTTLKQYEITVGINASLKDLALTNEDLGETYEPKDEEYITNPYTVSSGELLEGWTILEKYVIGFVDEEKILIQQLGRLTTLQLAEEYISLIKPFYSSFGYYEQINDETFGEESYLAISEENDEIRYVVSFRIKDIIVVIESIDLPLNSLIYFTTQLEENIINAIN